jgi:hypothetical protein
MDSPGQTVSLKSEKFEMDLGRLHLKITTESEKSIATLAVRVKRGGGGWVVDKACSQILAQLSAMAADDSSPRAGYY